MTDEKPAFFLRSMTAFGRAEVFSTVGRFLVEIQSVNRRHLEIQCSLPRQLNRFEIEMRKWIESKIGRGQVSLTLFWRSEEKESLVAVPNLALVKALKGAWKKIAEEISAPQELPLPLLMQQKDLIFFEEEIKEESLYQETLKTAVFNALDQAIRMKEKEGKALAIDLLYRISQIEDTIEKIAVAAPNASSKYREKLRNRLEELFTGQSDNEDKVLREVALFSEKIDITEEIVRLKSHLKQFMEIVKTPSTGNTETKGKTLEFLVQEMHREVNTIGSKSTELSISQWVIYLKSEIEKIREQVQNIE